MVIIMEKALNLRTHQDEEINPLKKYSGKDKPQDEAQIDLDQYLLWIRPIIRLSESKSVDFKNGVNAAITSYGCQDQNHSQNN